MTNIERAADIISYRQHQETGKANAPLNSGSVAEHLFMAGLLAPEPQIIRSAEDLMRVDGDSLIATHEEVASTTFGAHYMCYAADPEAMIYPMVVVATGAQVRAARTALQEATE